MSAKARIIFRSRAFSVPLAAGLRQQNMPKVVPSDRRSGTLTWAPIGVAVVIGMDIASGSAAVSGISSGRRPARMWRQ